MNRWQVNRLLDKQKNWTVYNSTQSVWSFPFLSTLAKFIIYWLFDNSHPDRCEVIAHCGFPLCNSPFPSMFSKKVLFLKKILFTFRERGREGERGEKHQSVSSCMSPNWGSGLQPRNVPWLGMKLTSDLFICRLVLTALSHTSQDKRYYFLLVPPITSSTDFFTKWDEIHNSPLHSLSGWCGW